MTVFDQTKERANRVFISYSSIDRVRTKGLGLLLEAMGHQVFHDHRTIKPGMKWRAALQEGLDEADAIMVFWTKHAAKSEWVRKEYEYFQATYPDRLLIPVLGDETPLTDVLKAHQQADFAPLVNEVLETKRRMKREGASTSEIQSAVMSRLQEAGVDVSTKRKRMWIFLLLGFGWLRTLLRYPHALARQTGNGAVEKVAQLSVGHVAAMGMIGAAGFVGGWRADAAPPPPDLPTWAESVTDSVTVMGGNVRSLASLVADGNDDMNGHFAGVEDTLVGINRRITTINESREEIYQHLVTILSTVRDADSLTTELTACRIDSTQLATQAAELTARIDSLRTPTTRDTPVVVAPPVDIPGAVFQPPAGEGEFSRPVALNAPMPAMPRRARQLGIQGDVEVTAIIDSSGLVTVESANGPRLLAQAAREAVEGWHFSPGLLDSEPTVWRMTVPVKFSYGIDFDPPPGEGSLVQPQPISAPYPEYPRAALERNIEGTVLVSASVKVDGTVGILGVQGGNEILNEAAERAVRTWKFAPGTRNGDAVEWQFTVPVTFRLRS